jgi:prephenate dehydrogenase
MWHDIALANQDAILQGIDDFSAHLDKVRAAIASGDGETLYATFDRAKRARDEHFLGQYLCRQKKSPSS